MLAPISSTPVSLNAPRSSSADREVQRGLPAERRQDRVGSLALDDGGDHVDVERLDVGPVGEVRVGHDRRRVRVGEDDAVALAAQDAARLRARVVELARLADDDRPGPEHEDRLDVGAARHQSGPSCVHEANEVVEQVRGVVRTGPRFGVVLHREGALVDTTRRPSTTPSLRLRWVISAPRHRIVGDRVVVVLAGDLDRAVAAALDRVVGAVVAERQLVASRRREPGPAAGDRGRSRRSAPARSARESPRCRSRPPRDRPGRSRGRRRRARGRAPPPPASTRARP